jgi:hypothetical protein
MHEDVLESELILQSIHEEFADSFNYVSPQIFYTLLSSPSRDGQCLKFGKTNDKKSLLKRLEERRRHVGDTWIHSVAYVDNAFHIEYKFKDFINEWIKVCGINKKDIWVSKEVVNIANLFDYDYRSLSSFLNKEIGSQEGYWSKDSEYNIEKLITESLSHDYSNGDLSDFDYFTKDGIPPIWEVPFKLTSTLSGQKVYIQTSTLTLNFS